MGRAEIAEVQGPRDRRRAGAPPVGLTVELADREEALVALREEWAELLPRTATNELALTWEWLYTWWSVFGDDSRRLLVLALRDARSHRLVGLAPLQVRAVAPYTWLPAVRRIEFLASGEPDADAICSDYVNMLAERGREREVARRVVAYLRADLAGAWDELHLTAMDAGAPVTDELASAFRDARLPLVRLPVDACPYLHLPTSWEDVHAALDARSRGELRRGTRRLPSHGQPSYHTATTPEEVGSHFEILVDLHRRRRAEKGTAGAFDSAAFTAFHRQLLPLALRAGWLELRSLALDGRPAVARYNFRYAGRVLYYQGGMDAAAAPGISLGLLMDAHCIREAVRDGLREYDFLRGAETYKRRWAPDTRELIALRVESGRPRAVALARHAARGARAVRGWMRKARLAPRGRHA